MSVTRTQARFNQRTDVFDNVTPNPFLRKTDGQDVPSGEFKPAAWLPIVFTRTDREQGTDYYVISKGKVVALDAQGFVVPAGLDLAMDGASALTYTATDVAQGVIDLTTGSPVAAAVTYSSLQLGKALLARGLVLEQEAVDASLTLPPTTNDHGHDIVQLFIKDPIGVILYDIHKWGGRPQDGDQTFTNWQRQDLIAFTTRAQMQVPLLAIEKSAESVDASGLSTQVYNAATNNQVDAGEYWSAANVSQITRFSGTLTSSSTVAAIGLQPGSAGVQYRIAKNTDRTPITCSDSAVLLRERASAALVTKAGDWFLDGDAGVLFLHSDTWSYLVGLGAAVTFGYFYYGAGAASDERYVYCVDSVKPGDHVTFDAQSNFAKGTRGTDYIVGRVTSIESQPRTLLDKVKTGWNTTGVSASAQMPGTATKGFTDLITLATEPVADTVVVINVNID